MPHIVNSVANNNVGTMFVDVVHNNISNSVLLVLPNGSFCTEISGAGKVPIDSDNPFRPTVKSFRDGVLHREGHSSRYLGDHVCFEDTN